MHQAFARHGHSARGGFMSAPCRCWSFLRCTRHGRCDGSKSPRPPGRRLPGDARRSASHRRLEPGCRDDGKKVSTRIWRTSACKHGEAVFKTVSMTGAGAGNRDRHAEMNWARMSVGTLVRRGTPHATAFAEGLASQPRSSARKRCGAPALQLLHRLEERRIILAASHLPASPVAPRPPGRCRILQVGSTSCVAELHALSTTMAVTCQHRTLSRRSGRPHHLRLASAWHGGERGCRAASAAATSS